MVCTGMSGSNKLALASRCCILTVVGSSALWIVKGKPPETIQLQQPWQEWAVQQYLE